MQARFSTPSSLAAHHRRLMASCAESGCLQVGQMSGAKLSALTARTVGESLCMSKSVEAYYKGQIVSARDLPTGCQQRCSLVVPTVRALRHLTEPSAKSPQHQDQPSPRDAATADQRLMTRTLPPRQAEATAGLATDFGRRAIFGPPQPRAGWLAAVLSMYPRAPRISLTATGLDMPAVDHLSNNGALNVLLDRAISGLPSGLPPDRPMVALFINFARLTSKALREYNAARAELLRYVEPHDGLRMSIYLRALDHLENCVSATHRAVLNARALQANGIC